MTSKRTSDFISVGESLNEMIDSYKLRHGIDNVLVKEAWKEVMGQGVMSYTNEIVLKKDTLIIKLSSSALREEVKLWKRKDHCYAQ